MKTYKFEDAQTMALLHPDTFEAPTNEELEAIKVGSTVKVCTNDERFWTEVTEVDGNKIKATVDNDLVDPRNKELVYQTEIEFEKKNIYSIWVN